MIFTPCSLIQTTYFPERDHLMLLTVPSPECRTVSLPVLDPRPMLPSHPAAAAAAVPTVVEVLRPGWPPTVKMSWPASPPDRYVRSFLKSGDRATAWTGRAKLRSCTSFMSIRLWTQTLPSKEEVAIWMLFDGMFGIAGGSLDRRDAAAGEAASDRSEPPAA